MRVGEGYSSSHDDAGRAERRGPSPSREAASYANHQPLEVYHVTPDDDFLRLQPLFGCQLHLHVVRLRHERRVQRQRRTLPLRQHVQLRELCLRAGLQLQRVIVVPT